MSCLTTLVTEPVNNCISLLTIGTISALNQDVVVQLKNTATGRIDAFDATSSGAGLVIVDLSEFELLANSAYMIRILNNLTPYDITIGSDSSEAVVMPVGIVNGGVMGNVTLVGV